MGVPVVTLCPHCSAEGCTDYTALGRVVRCERCGVEGVPVVGSSYPPTGRAIRFSDFLQLAHDEDTRGRLNELLARWYGFAAQTEGGAILIRSRDGKVCDPFSVHAQIQADEIQQAELYNFAMGVWHS